jgi:hypothetical protein
MKPRQLIHRGTVLAAALWIDEALIGVETARRRILRLSGIAEVRKVAGGLFVRWCASRLGRTR